MIIEMIILKRLGQYSTKIYISICFYQWTHCLYIYIPWQQAASEWINNRYHDSARQGCLRYLSTGLPEIFTYRQGCLRYLASGLPEIVIDRVAWDIYRQGCLRYLSTGLPEIFSIRVGGDIYQQVCRYMYLSTGLPEIFIERGWLGYL